MLALADDAALARLVIAAAKRRATSTESKLSYRAVEGMPVQPRTASERLISLGHRPSTATAAPCPHFATVATALRPTAAAPSNCSPPPLTAATRRSCGRMAFRPRKWSASCALGSRLRTASVWLPGSGETHAEMDDLR